MSSRSIRAVAFVLVLLFASMSPLAIPAQAHQSIILSTDTSHVVLMPGSAGNVTLTIENNATAIETFNVSVDSAGLSNLWNISASEDTVENVFPTWSKNTTIIVRLAEGAVPADSGSFDIHVTEPDQNFTSVITIYVSVAPSYLPILNLASMGGPLVSMDSGTNTTFTIDVENLGSVEDTLLLDVEYEPDLAAWWANYTNGSSNNSGNNTGNNTGGNGSGNNTGGNNTGGNGTGGNGSGSWNTSSFAYANIKVAGGHDHACGILDNGDLKCWGNDEFGQLGDGGTNTDTNAPSTTAIDLGTGRTAVAVSAGRDHVCAILDNGDLKCWGYDYWGALGDGGSNTDTNAPSSTAIDLGTGRTAVAVSSHKGQHTCAILDNGDMKCWGKDTYGQLGDGGSNTQTNAPSTTAIDLGMGRTADAISTTLLHTCAILDNGDLKCWGRDSSGQLGDGGSDTDTNAPSSTPIDLGTGRTAVAVSTGNYHTCAILDNGDLKCWGSDSYGQLGDGGSNTNQGSPVSVDLGTGRTAVAVSGGGYHTCAILDNGDMKCWGQDTYGQLGDSMPATDTNAPSSTPIAFGTGRTPVAVSAGGRHTCAILDNGDMKCWGKNYDGQLGIGVTGNSAVAPLLVSGNNTWNSSTGASSGPSGNNTTIISNVLMFGNSYTSFNSLHSIVEALGISNADALTGGGKTLAGHWSDVNSSHVSNTTLRNANIDWDYVILQDQSQIPGFNRTNADWIASKDAAVNLADVIGDEGGESILMMTWGRRNGDAMNPTLYSNFSVMQDRLESGYMDYHSNITNAGHTVWMAPVGLAFAHIHDNVVAAGFNASVTGNTFYDLYNADGSHPSLAGSYLAACVLYATMTGETPVGSNDTVALSSSLKLELQQAAAATVFNETSHLTYPWQSTTTTASMSLMSSRGLGGGIPNGWSVQWVDDQFTNMPAGSSSTANLHVSVPSNAAPDYYGFRLFSASTGGNVSTSTLLVVQVDEEHNLSIVFLDQSSAFIPGLSTDTEIQVTNTGNAQVDYNWALELIDGPCTASLATASTPGLSPNDVANIQFQITVHEEATKTDDCDLKLDATGDSTSQQHSITPYSFTIDIDELVAFELVAPMSSLEVTPGSPISYEMRILNNGSETVNFYLDVMTPSELETAFVSSSSVEVAQGGVGVWTLTTDGVSGNQGIFSQLFSVSYLGQTSHSSLAIDVLGVEQVALTGPLDGRIQTRPSDSVTTSFTLSNTGTSDLELYGSLLGLPAGADATLSHTSLMLSVGQNIEVNLTISTQSSVAAGSYQISFAYFSSNTSVESIIILQVQERYSVTLNPMFLLPNEEIPVGPNSSSGVMFDMINTGSTQDTLLVSVVDYDDAFDWFEFEIFATTVTLDSGLSTYNTVSFREHTTGAPAGGLSIGIIVKSATDSEVMDHINITLIPFTPGADLQVLSDDDSAEPGGVIHGTVVVTNTGNAIDTLQITTVGIDCGMTATHQLLPGQSSPSIPWSCTLPADADAGLKELKFRATSSARPSFSTLSSEIYTVEPVWGSSGVIEITFDENELSIPSSGGSSVMVSVSNLANAQVTGSLNIEGVGDGLVALEWIRLLDNTSTNLFTLTPGSSIQYKLSLNSLVSTSEDASLSVRATYVIDETTQSDVSSSLNIDIVGPEQPPNGVQLPFDVQLSQSDSLNAMFGGWLFSFLILGVLYLRRSKKEIPLMDDEVDSDTEEEETVEEESTLGYNECRMEGDKVSCPSCEARLGVPRGSDPPFRFTCPKCSTLIRVVD